MLVCRPIGTLFARDRAEGRVAALRRKPLAAHVTCSRYRSTARVVGSPCAFGAAHEVPLHVSTTGPMQRTAALLARARRAPLHPLQVKALQPTPALTARPTDAAR